MDAGPLSRLLSEIKNGCRHVLGENLTGIYLHGSVAFGCFRWEKSDIDFLVVVKEELPHGIKRRLMDLILRLSESAPPKGLEMSVVLEAECRHVRHPVPFLLHYSNMHRERYRENPEEYLAEMNGVDPDLAAYFEVVRRTGIVLCGAPVDRIFGEVPYEAFFDSIRRNAAEGGGDASGILNLCRYAAFAGEGRVLSKRDGGFWGLKHLPEKWRGLIRCALDIESGIRNIALNFNGWETFRECIMKECVLRILSLRDAPQELERFIRYFSGRWHNEAVYRDCMTACLNSDSPLPQWYLLLNEKEEIIGGAGLIISDFSARGDLWPWFCALYIEEAYRGHAYGARLIAHVKTEAARLGYRKLYLCTDHAGYYEKYGFGYLGVASDPFGSSSRIYCAETQDDWDFLVTAAKAKLHPRTLSPFIDAGGVAASLLTEAGNVYTGVCIDTACSLGMCAERNAVASMITGGERRIVKLVCLMGDGSPGMPCGACRELLMQLDARSGDIEILVSYPDIHTVMLNELMPQWWGKERLHESDH